MRTNSLTNRILFVILCLSMKTLTKDYLLIADRRELVNKILSLQEETQKKSSRIEELEFQLDWFKRQTFGTKSETFIPDDELQTALVLGIKEAEHETHPEILRE